MYLCVERVPGGSGGSRHLPLGGGSEAAGRCGGRRLTARCVFRSVLGGVFCHVHVFCDLFSLQGNSQTRAQQTQRVKDHCKASLPVTSTPTSHPHSSPEVTCRSQGCLFLKPPYEWNHTEKSFSPCLSHSA